MKQGPEGSCRQASRLRNQMWRQGVSGGCHRPYAHATREPVGDDIEQQQMEAIDQGRDDPVPLVEPALREQGECAREERRIRLFRILEK